MTARNFSVALNFLLEFVSDKSKLELLAKETERILKQSKPELEFDTTKFKKRPGTNIRTG